MGYKGMMAISTLAIASVIGWLLNLLEAIKFMVSGAEWTTFEIFQVVGIFAAPIGAVMGWVSLFV